MQISDLHRILFFICLSLLVVVFSIVLYTGYKHGKMADKHKSTHFHHANTIAEMIWMLVPFLIVVCLIWPALKVMMNL